MAFYTLLRDGENLSEAMLQREMASGFSDCPVVSGVGTGYSAGMIGKMNGATGSNPNHFSCTATGTTLVLTFQPGWMYVVKDSGSSSYDPRVILVGMTTAATVTLANNASGTTRVSTLCLRVDQTIAPDATGSNIVSIVEVQGGASSALSNAPSDGALYVPICNVTILNAATSVAQGAVADKRLVHPSQAQFNGHNSVATSVATGAVATQITLVADSDKAGMLVSNQWKCPLPGLYTFGINLGGVPAAAAGVWASELFVNATQVKAGAQYVCNTSGVLSPGAGQVQLAYGDLVDLRGLQTSGAAVNSLNQSVYTYLSLVWVGF